MQKPLTRKATTRHPPRALSCRFWKRDERGRLGAHGLFLQANLSAATMLGVVRGRLVSRRFTQYVFKKNQDVFYLLLKQLEVGGKQRSCELRLGGVDGKPFWVQVSATAVLDEQGKLTYRVVLTDISESRQAESDVVVANQKLARLSDEKGICLADPCRLRASRNLRRGFSEDAVNRGGG